MNRISCIFCNLAFLGCFLLFPVLSQAQMLKPLEYAEHSVLATGQWFKFTTSSEGIYKISFDDLNKAGFNPGSIDPRNIRIYGNGGGMLPESNDAERVDDLKENAIFIAGEDDGKFDKEDFILFYGESPDKWYYSQSDKLFRHQKNIYTGTVTYFLTADLGPGKRIGTLPQTSKPAVFIADRFDDFAFIENDDVSLTKSGRQWWDKQYYDLTTFRSFNFTFPDLDISAPLTVTTHVAARSTVGNTSFTVLAQDAPVLTIQIPAINGGFESSFANERTGQATFSTSNPSVTIGLNYNKSSSSSVGYLNYIQLNATRLLKMNGAQMFFRNVGGVQPQGVTEFRMTTGAQSLKIWDVTEPGNIRQVQATVNGNSLIFRLETEKLMEFAAFDGQTFLSPEFAGTLVNQDLHGMATVDYLIVAHPNFLSEAQRLAAFHEQFSNLSVAVVTPEAIYNEFSSGSQDVAAIRDFARMLYNRGNQGAKLKYLLLFGDASYDFRNRTENNTNFVPSYESYESLSPLSSFVSDDFFGLLEHDEGQSARGDLDIGIGRFPVDNVSQARTAVDKVIHYCSSSDSVRNDWRNVVTFVADDQNEGGNLFIDDSEDLAKIIESQYKDYNVDKIYTDAFDAISTPGGLRYPEVNTTISKRVEKGSLLVNYVGHGGELGWGHERFLEVADIQGWKNLDNMPVFVTATCEFSRFDDPERISAGEWVFLNEKGGGVGLFTTTRLTFAGTNKALLENFYAHVFSKIDGHYMRMGDLLRASKKDMGNSPNVHAFVLLGDPAMIMAYPENNVVTTAIRTGQDALPTDTLRALSEITIEGEVRNFTGERISDFNGTVFPTVFDKWSEVWTKANQGQGDPVQFFLQKNPVYKGQVQVNEGRFSFTFIVPKDIAYQYGPGKISYYARSGQSDANGFGEVKVGGYNNGAMPDMDGPELALYMNTRDFRSGGITNQNPKLLADVSDASGINTVGNGIGHDITAILDEESSNPVILNDYYVSDLNTFKSGTISYPLNGITSGRHTLTVKVWDVYNNSTSRTIEFVVEPASSFAVDRLYNYPNPMVDHTTFSFETNQVEQVLASELSIFNMMGEQVRVLQNDFYSNGFRYVNINWDGTSTSGAMVSRGLYICRLKLTMADGSTREVSSKLMVSR